MSKVCLNGHTISPNKELCDRCNMKEMVVESPELSESNDNKMSEEEVKQPAEGEGVSSEVPAQPEAPAEEAPKEEASQ